MPSELSDRPDVHKLARFVERVLSERDDVEFVVLFGSMAKGNWSLGSDYDVLIGLTKDDGLRLMDRMLEFDQLVEGNIEVFPYAAPEWRQMIDSFHLFFLEALDHGVVLFDRGAFAAARRRFEEWRAKGIVTPLEKGWRIAP